MMEAHYTETKEEWLPYEHVTESDNMSTVFFLNLDNSLRELIGVDGN